MYTKVGKIEKAAFGFGGYQDSMFGFSFDFGGAEWSGSDFRGSWVEPSWGVKSTGKMSQIVRDVMAFMIEAKVSSFDQLVGKPVEVTFDDTGRLVSWRILIEVL